MVLKIGRAKSTVTEVDQKTAEILALIKTQGQKGVLKGRFHPDLKLIAIALRACGKTYAEIADTLGASQTTVQSWINALDNGEYGFKELTDTVKKQMASKCYNLANSVLSNVSDEDIARASLLQKGTFAAVMIDKARLIENQSTDNVAVIARHVAGMGHELEKTNDAAERLEREIEAIQKSKKTRNAAPL